MLIFKLISHFATGLVAFCLSTGIVGGYRYVMPTATTSTQSSVLTRRVNAVVQEPNTEAHPSGIYFVAPSVGSSPDCPPQGEIYPFGWDSFLQTSQMPHIRRMARDGRWLFFETDTADGRSFEFFGIVPDSADTASQKKVAVTGKLIRLTNGEITGNVDATYYLNACVLK